VSLARGRAGGRREGSQMDSENAGQPEPVMVLAVWQAPILGQPYGHEEVVEVTGWVKRAAAAGKLLLLDPETREPVVVEAEPPPVVERPRPRPRRRVRPGEP
jgi:hypothetical protein